MATNFERESTSQPLLPRNSGGKKKRGNCGTEKDITILTPKLKVVQLKHFPNTISYKLSRFIWFVISERVFIRMFRPNVQEPKIG